MCFRSAVATALITMSYMELSGRALATDATHAVWDTVQFALNGVLFRPSDATAMAVSFLFTALSDHDRSPKMIAAVRKCSDSSLIVRNAASRHAQIVRAGSHGNASRRASFPGEFTDCLTDGACNESDGCAPRRESIAG